MSTSTNRWSNLLHQRKATNELLRERKDATPAPAPVRTATPAPESRDDARDEARQRLEEARNASGT